MGAHERDVSYKGKKYRLSVSEKIGDDGVIETHMNYDAHHAPRQEKRKANLVLRDGVWWRWDYEKQKWKKDTKTGRLFK